MKKLILILILIIASVILIGCNKGSNFDVVIEVVGYEELTEIIDGVKLRSEYLEVKIVYNTEKGSVRSDLPKLYIKINEKFGILSSIQSTYPIGSRHKVNVNDLLVWNETYVRFDKLTELTMFYEGKQYKEFVLKQVPRNWQYVRRKE